RHPRADSRRATLSLHDALPISVGWTRNVVRRRCRCDVRAGRRWWRPGDRRSDEGDHPAAAGVGEVRPGAAPGDRPGPAPGGQGWADGAVAVGVPGLLPAVVEHLGAAGPG